MNTEQEDFERWYLAQSVLNVVDKAPCGLAASPDEIYSKPTTRRAWAAWRAGAARASERISKAVAELRDMIDGGEECLGRDQQISKIIRILEGKDA